MALVELSLLKAHVRADDFTEDDAYLSSVLESAEAWVVQATARDEGGLLELGGGVFPSQLRQAVLLLAGHWYNQREAVGSSSLAEVPYTVQALVKPFRLLGGKSEEETASEAADRAERAADRAEAAAALAEVSAEVAAEKAAEIEDGFVEIPTEKITEIWDSTPAAEAEVDENTEGDGD